VSEERPYRVGFDIGGTFTDFALHDERSGALHVLKRLSTPADPSVAALAGIDELLSSAGATMAGVAQVVHGTTIGANTVIERKGARTALVVTEGFRDLLVMQRPARYSTYDLWFDKHVPLVPRDLVLPIAERRAYDGAVVRPLDADAVREVVAELERRGVEAVAVSFLHAYADGAHEREVAAAIASALPDAALSVSHEVAPIIGEYERTSTTVVNAYVQPAFRRYLARLDDALRERGFAGRLLLNQGNGGLTTPAEVVRFPVRALESGPAAGVSMAAWVGGGAGRSELVAFDMGGTTAKACLVEGGEPRMERTFDVDQTLMRKGTGLPVATPTVDLIEIGAGGGSIARVSLGIVEVGPESAGADPGPACYGRGGTRATVTDANVALGYLNPDYFLGGEMALDAGAAASAVAADVGEPLGLGLAEAAWGVHEAVTSNMEHAIRSVSIERGRDPRDLTLVAFGGAGPTHAARLARNLGIGEVLFPAAAGIASAVGLLQAAPRVDVARTLVTALDDEDGIARLRAVLAELRDTVRERLAGVAGETALRLVGEADMQYVGQGHVVEVEVPPLDAPEFGRELRERFERRYAALYGYSYDGATPQVAGVRMVGTVTAPPFDLPRNDAAAAPPSAAARPVYFPEAGGFADCAVHRRDALPAGTRIAGPAVIEDGQCAILLLPGDVATVDDHRNVLAQVAAAGVAGTAAVEEAAA
jgi:N-methylhydantoinase A/oxoprolinase/acetone carboxylase beta subunit